MAYYDEATTAFFAKVADTEGKVQSPLDHEHQHPVKDALSLARRVIKGTNNPGKVISKAVVSAATRELLKEAAMSPLKLFEILNDHYGKDWWDWEPETIWTMLEKEQGIKPDDELKNMLMAFQVAVNTNAPFEHWHVFEKTGHAFNQNIVDFNILQPLELDEAALTVKTLNRLRPATGFEDEVCGYIAAIAKECGVVYLPVEYFDVRCQNALDALNNNLDLRDRVKKAWPAEKASDATLNIQLGRLHEIGEYLTEQGG